MTNDKKEAKLRRRIEFGETVELKQRTECRSCHRLVIFTRPRLMGLRFKT